MQPWSSVDFDLLGSFCYLLSLRVPVPVMQNTIFTRPTIDRMLDLRQRDARYGMVDIVIRLVQAKSLDDGRSQVAILGQGPGTLLRPALEETHRIKGGRLDSASGGARWDH
jgi:hypothetical protein